MTIGLLLYVIRPAEFEKRPLYEMRHAGISPLKYRLFSSANKSCSVDSSGSTNDFVLVLSNRFFVSSSPARGLPPRIYIPIAALIAVVFLSIMVYLLRIGFGVSGAALGDGTPRQAQREAGQAQQVQGGPPPAVAAQLQQLRAQIAAHPKDDVALVQLGDLYLAVQKYADAIPLYKRALAANPKNVAARAGLDEATTGLAAEQQH